MNINEDLDTLVRDLTQVGSIPKSEARRRIEEYTEGRVSEAVREVFSIAKEEVNHSYARGVPIYVREMQAIEIYARIHDITLTPPTNQEADLAVTII